MVNRYAMNVARFVAHFGLRRHCKGRCKTSNLVPLPRSYGLALLRCDYPSSELTLNSIAPARGYSYQSERACSP